MRVCYKSYKPHPERKTLLDICYGSNIQPLLIKIEKLIQIFLVSYDQNIYDF